MLFIYSSGKFLTDPEIISEMFCQKRSECEAPSSPQCFRRNNESNVYDCEWSMKTTHRDNLQKHTSYQVKLRHRTKVTRNPLWSEWSPLVIVPAGDITVSLYTVDSLAECGSLNQTLKHYFPVHHEAAVTGVTYILKDTQSSGGCPCKKKTTHLTDRTEYTGYISYSPVNFSMIATNKAGSSPTAIIHVPAEPAPNLKGTIYKVGLELSAAYTVYCKDKCVGTFPKIAPQDLLAFNETHSSVTLSWNAIPTEDRRGVLTHYNVCSVQLSSNDEHKQCHRVPASVAIYRLENLMPVTKYNITVAGVTSAGEGPKATVTLNTQLINPMTGIGPCIHILCYVTQWSWFSNIAFFFLTNRMQEMLEEKEEVVTLQQLHPKDPVETTMPLNIDIERPRVSDGRRDDALSPSSIQQALRGSKEEEMPDQEEEQMLALLLYRNRLVFDMNTD
uniref:Fibronectin type-III domain-containing protein n=1 Tax=Hippocampus comes TaxID=109280 RepID=A0A3Q2YSZ1_HIPCM